MPQERVQAPREDEDEGHDRSRHAACMRIVHHCAQERLMSEVHAVKGADRAYRTHRAINLGERMKKLHTQGSTSCDDYYELRSVVFMKYLDRLDCASRRIKLADGDKGASGIIHAAECGRDCVHNGFDTHRLAHQQTL